MGMQSISGKTRPATGRAGRNISAIGISLARERLLSVRFVRLIYLTKKGAFSFHSCLFVLSSYAVRLAFTSPDSHLNCRVRLYTFAEPNPMIILEIRRW